MTLRKTPLNDRHRSLGAKMVPFAGWDMPVQYHSIIQEHQAVRNAAGLFDVSHMGEIFVRGPGAVQFLDHVTCNYVSTMDTRRVSYNALLNKNGGLVDDLTMYRIGPDEFFIVANASNTGADLSHLRSLCPESGVEIIDESSKWHQIAIQGPEAAEILAKALKLPELLEMQYYHFNDFQINGDLYRISRTGYTGEDGFEVYTSNDEGVRLWDVLLNEGKDKGLMPVGLGARDSLRLEARFPLYGHELSEEMTPSQSGIGWIAREKDEPYLGYEKIMDHKKNGVPDRVAGFILEGPGIARDDYRVFDPAGEKEIGRVLSGAHSPMLNKGVGTAYLPIEFIQPGSQIQIEIRGKQTPAMIHKGPFYRGTAGKIASGN